MAQTFFKIRGVDPLLFRDGRPFDAAAGGLTAQSLPLPFPTTVAAFVRSQIGAAMQWNWNHEDCQRAHGIPVHGPLLLRDGQIVLPTPKDALLNKQAIPAFLRPDPTFADCCDLPDGMAPLMRKMEKDAGDDSQEGKPPKGYNFWTKEALLKWLQNESPGVLEKISGLPTEERIGIEMDAVSGKSKEGQLYATRLRAFGEKTEKEPHIYTRHEYALVARVNLPDGNTVRSAGTLGGERRMTIIKEAADTPDIWPRCPPTLKEKLKAVKVGEQVRMVLATPAHFDGGWRPGWIEKSGSGAVHLPAGIAQVRLKLIGAAVGRREAVSGWGLREGKPREIRWLVPAGSVFFFEVTGGDPGVLAKDAWMTPVSNNEQEQRDGLGLALWGIG